MAASGNTFFFLWEVNLMEWLQAHVGAAGISIISIFSMFGEELLMILILGFVYWRRNAQGNQCACEGNPGADGF